MIHKFGRKIVISTNFFMAGIFYLLVQICSDITTLTVFLFGVRTFITGVFNTIYIYTGEVWKMTTGEIISRLEIFIFS